MIDKIQEYFRYFFFTAVPLVIAALMVVTVLALFSMALCSCGDTENDDELNSLKNVTPSSQAMCVDLVKVVCEESLKCDHKKYEVTDCYEIGFPKCALIDVFTTDDILPFYNECLPSMKSSECVLGGGVVSLTQECERIVQ